MYTSVKLICLSTLVVASPVLPHEVDRASLDATQLDISQQQLIAKKPAQKKEGCGSSPTPGCSRRDHSGYRV
ncbi:MAG: hypothetical protein ACRC62_24030 [Microcoleus sp.]